MSKNIVVYSDGTGQDGGRRPEQRVSNVYKMYRASPSAPTPGSTPPCRSPSTTRGSEPTSAPRR